MTTSEVIESLRECLPNRPIELGADESLLDSGVLDSLNFLAFVSSIEKRFDVALSEDVVFGPCFNTLGEIAKAISAERMAKRA